MINASPDKQVVKTSPFGWRQGLLITSAVMMVFAVLAEAVLHRIPSFRPVPHLYVGDYANLPVNKDVPQVPDPVLGWRMRPLDHFGTQAHYRTNSSGFRSNREFTPSAAGKNMIALVGDSFTFGFGVEYDETFGAVIESRLHDTQVDNFGVAGFGVDQAWLAMRTEALPLNPKLVVAAFIEDDFGRSLEPYRFKEGLGKPAYKLRDGNLVLRTAQDRPNGLVLFLEAHSSLWKIEGMAMRTASHYVPVGQWWQLNEAILDRMREDCRSRGVRLLLVYISTKAWPRLPTFLAYSQRVHADFLYLTGDLLPLTGTRLPDGHPNPAGHRYIADAISRWIQENMPELTGGHS